MYLDERCSYLVIERDHEVAVDWGAIRLVFQGTLFSVKFNLFIKKQQHCDHEVHL